MGMGLNMKALAESQQAENSQDPTEQKPAPPKMPVPGIKGLSQVPPHTDENQMSGTMSSGKRGFGLNMEKAQAIQ
jgi:hypothetical protein